MRTSANSIHPQSVKNRPTIIPDPPQQSQTLCYTSRAMARCPLCSERPAKRFCSAKNSKICPVCCGSRREVDIDCPSSCYFLQAGRAYENDQRVPDPELAAAVQHLDKGFIYRHSLILNGVCHTIHE